MQMETGELILLEEFCTVHKVEISFVQLLEEHGMLETVETNRAVCIYSDQLPRLEQMVRLHQELNVNPEGIDVINNLLQQIDDMQTEMTNLRNKLSFYE